MANSAILRSTITNPTKFLLKPSQALLTRPFSSSNPTRPEPKSHPTQITLLDPNTQRPISLNQNNIIEELFKLQTEGLFVSARKVFDKMSRRGNRNFRHEQQMGTSKAKIPEVLPHIAVLEAYANAGETNHKYYMEYLKMVGAGSIPNEETYNHLITLIVKTSDGDSLKFKQAEKYVTEMLDKGMKPNAETVVSIFKELAKDGRVREGKEMLAFMKTKGFVVDYKVFKAVVGGGSNADVIRLLKGKNGNIIKTLLEIFFDKKI